MTLDQAARPTLADTEIVEIETTSTVAVRISLPMADLDLGAAFDRYLPAAFEAIGKAGGRIAGPPFGWYHAYGPDLADVEIGFPVGAALAGLRPLASVAPGTPGRSALPGGLVARAIHRGRYDTLHDAYEPFRAWILDQPGVELAGGPWESYVDDPAAVADPTQVRTAIVWPIRRH